MRLDVAGKVVRDEVEVAVLAHGRHHAGKVLRLAKGALLNLLKDARQVRVDLVLLLAGPVDVRVAQLFDLLGEVAKEEDVLLTDLARDFDLDRCILGAGLQWGGCLGKETLTLAPSQVPIIRPPLSTNFMLLVPEALSYVSSAPNQPTPITTKELTQCRQSRCAR
jgi:hypothetical protein